ncbi:MAG: transglutaminaseTgpA domain-containing protein [Phycisphaerales bacterium]|nr:transglutaminaseTgpA domain-containing protein [Phycisphaerales bacterium]
MTPLSRYRRHLRIEVLLAVTAYAVALQTFELMFVLGAAALASGYVSDGPRGRYLPIWVTTVLAAMLFGWSVFSFLANPDPASVMALVGRLGCSLAVLRLFGRRSAREDRQVILLAVVAVVGACLYSFQFLFGLLVVVFSLHTVQVIMLNRLQSGLDDARADRRGLTADLPVPPVEAASGRSPIGEFRGLVVGCTFVACVLATGVFLIFPRQIDADGASLGSRTGFTPEVDLTRNDQLEQSNREVFTVEWADPQGVPIQWPQPLRLRGAVLDRWNAADRRWMARAGRRYLRTVTTSGDPDEFVSLGAAEIGRGLYTQTVTMRSLATSRVFARWAPLAIACDQPRTFTIDPADLELEDTITGELDRFTTYRLLVDPNPSPEAIESIAGDAIPPVRPPIFNVPEVREEAERILSERAPELLEPLIDADEAVRWRRNRQIAETFTRYLRGDDFRYTLDLRRFVQRRGVDPIHAFLTEYRFGHCEYFASGLAGLCQSLGIECRVVTGFVAVEYDDALGRYIVRESNAHAWVEVRTGRWSWREFDPTSSEVLDELQAGRRSWADDWRWLYDRADFLWTSRFVTFDGKSQATLADRFGALVGSGGWGVLEDARSIARKVNKYFQLGPAGYIWLGIVALAVSLGVVAIVAELRRRRRIRQVLHAGRDVPLGRLREAAFYLDLLDVFEVAGCAKPGSTPPLKHLDEVLRVRPDVAEAARPLVELFYEVRFGDRRLDASARRSAAESVVQLRAIAEGGLS